MSSILFKNTALLDPLQPAAQGELLQDQSLLFDACWPARRLRRVPDHDRRNAEEAADFLDRERARFEHLRIFRLQRELYLHRTTQP